MTKFLAIVNTVYRHSGFRYLVIGGSTFLFDLGILMTLHSAFGVNVFISATISYWLSLFYNFILNRIWSFGAKSGVLKQHIATYACLIFFNYLASIGIIAVLTPLGVNYTLAKAIAVILSMSWNYIIYKHIIFRPSDLQANYKL